MWSPWTYMRNAGRWYRLPPWWPYALSESAGEASDGIPSAEESAGDYGTFVPRYSPGACQSVNLESSEGEAEPDIAHSTEIGVVEMVRVFGKEEEGESSDWVSLKEFSASGNAANRLIGDEVYLVRFLAP